MQRSTLLSSLRSRILFARIGAAVALRLVLTAIAVICVLNWSSEVDGYDFWKEKPESDVGVLY